MKKKPKKQKTTPLTQTLPTHPPPDPYKNIKGHCRCGRRPPGGATPARRAVAMAAGPRAARGRPGPSVRPRAGGARRGGAGPGGARAGGGSGTGPRGAGGPPCKMAAMETGREKSPGRTGGTGRGPGTVYRRGGARPKTKGRDRGKAAERDGGKRDGQNKAAEKGKGGLGRPQPRSPRTAVAAEASQQHKDKAGPLGSVLRAVCAAGLSARRAAGGSLRLGLMPSGS